MFRLMNKLALVVFYFVMTYPVSGEGDDALASAGMNHYHAGRYEAAVSALLPYLKAHASDGAALRILVLSYIQLERDDEAADAAERLVALDGENAEYQYTASLAYGLRAQKAGMLKKAGFAKKMKSAVERAIALDPDHLPARRVLMQFHMHAPGFMGGDKAEAERQADAIKARNPMRGHLAWVMIHMQAERFQDAENEFRQSIAEQPDSLAHYFGFQEWLAGRDRIPEAIDLLRQALAVDSTSVEAWMQMGRWSMESRDYAQALDASRKALILEPDSPNALYQMGKAAALSGLALEEALDCLDRYDALPSIDKGEGIAWSQIRRGQILEHLKRTDEAKAAYEAALSVDQDNETARTSLKRLQGDS